MSNEFKTPWSIVHMADGTSKIQDVEGGEVLK